MVTAQKQHSKLEGGILTLKNATHAFLLSGKSSQLFSLKGTLATASLLYGLSVFDSLFTHEPREPRLPRGITHSQASPRIDGWSEPGSRRSWPLRDGRVNMNIHFKACHRGNALQYAMCFPDRLLDRNLTAVSPLSFVAERWWITWYVPPLVLDKFFFVLFH